MSIDIYVRMVSHVCLKCSGVFGLLSDVKNELVKTQKTFGCPYCFCKQYYTGPTEEQKLHKKLQEKSHIIESLREMNCSANKRADTNSRRANAYKGLHKKTRNQIKAGNCPCCKKHFKGLKTHLERMHPGYGIKK